MCMVDERKPILFLDVDGVLNVFEPFSVEVDEYLVTSTSGTPEPIFVPKGSRECVKFLSNKFDIVWATAWEGSAHTALKEALDLEDEPWPHIDWLGKKISEILKYASDRPWAWVDDFAIWELDQLGWSTPDEWEDRIHKRPHRLFMDNTFILAPNYHEGLTANHVGRLVEFAYNLETEA
jgi:hypothetical protein